MVNTVENRRLTRIRRSALTSIKLHEVEMPNMRISKKFDELYSTFHLVYKQYMKQGYIKKEHPKEIYYNIHSFLPKTRIFSFCSHKKVISTISLIQDSKLFGLPMDHLYKSELDTLRNNGRKIAEVSALASDSDYNTNNVVMFLFKAVIHFSIQTGVNELCLMVNPKHKRFYADIMLCEQIGEEKYYPSVNAQAVAMHLTMDTYYSRLDQVYGAEELTTNLSTFIRSSYPTILDQQIKQSCLTNNSPLDTQAAQFFFVQRPEILRNLTPFQQGYLEEQYPEVFSKSMANCINCS